jgi:hypothetical protein
MKSSSLGFRVGGLHAGLGLTDAFRRDRGLDRGDDLLGSSWMRLGEGALLGTLSGQRQLG